MKAIYVCTFDVMTRVIAFPNATWKDFGEEDKKAGA